MRTRRLVLIGGIVALILVGVVLALPYLVDVNRYRGQVQLALQERLGRQVSIGEMRVSLFPVGLRVEKAVIGDDPRFQTSRPFVSVEELYVSPRLLPLVSGRFELRSVELRRPAIELVRDAAGTWNFATLGGGGERGEKDDGEAPALVLDQLVITSGQVALTDLQAPGSEERAVYSNIDVALDRYAPDRPFGIRLTATLPGEGTQRISVSGTAGPVVQDAIAMTPFDGELALEQVSISGAQRFLKLEALEGTDAVISGRADLRNREGQMSSSGSLRLDDTRARGVVVGYPISADFDVAHDTAAGQLTITKGTLRLDKTPLSLTGTVDLQPETPVLDVHATASDASLAEAARLASAFGVAFGAGTQVQGRLNADVRARGPADRPSLEGQLRLRDVSISGADIPQQVRTGAVDVTLTPNEIRSNEFMASTGGTSLGVQAAVSQYTTAMPVLDARVRTTNADLGDVLSVARAWGVEAVEGTSGTGRLTIDLQARGPLETLTYSGSGSLRDATLKSSSITQPLRVRTANLTFNRDTATLANLAASIGTTSAEGRLTLRRFAAPQVDFDLSADKVDVKEMQALLAPDAPKTPSGEPASGDSLLRLTTGSGRLRVGQIAYDQLILDDVQATATLDRGLIRLDPVTAGLFGGRHRGAIVMDARRTPAVFTVASDLERVDANRLASSVTNLRDVIHGALGSRVRMTFAAGDANSVAQSLNGTLSLDLAEGSIANMDLTHEVGNIARFLTGQARAERSTRVAGLSGTFDVKDGLARTENLTASIGGGTLGAAGTVNLVDQRLNLRLTTVLSREFAQRVGGTRVGGFMTTALANQQGELVVPLLVTGTTQQPRFAPDAQRVAEMKVRSLVPSLKNPQGLTSTILGAIAGQQKEGREGQPPPRSAIGDIVGAITGRDKPATPPPDVQQKDAAAPPEGQAAPKPAPADRGKQVEDVLRGLLGGKKKEEPQNPPAETPAK